MSDRHGAIRRILPTPSLIVLFLVFIGLSVAAFIQSQVTQNGLETEARLSSARADSLEKDQTKASLQARALLKQVKQLGGTPVVNSSSIPQPQGTPGATGATGAQGAQGVPGRAPTQDEIQRAVALYCDSSGACAGKRPTATQVAIAINTYCGSDGRCRGRQGEQGNAGATGSQGPQGAQGPQGEPGAQGPQGDPPTAEQIEAAVDTYCSSGKCVGPKGDTGSVKSGSYLCNDNEYLQGFTVTDDGSVTKTCRTLPGLLGAGEG